jgi:hypothetical protein
LKTICTKNNKKWIIHSFEANPLFDLRLDYSKTIVESFGHTHYLYKNRAAWIRDDEIKEFYLDIVNADVNHWGSSLHK